MTADGLVFFLEEEVAVEGQIAIAARRTVDGPGESREGVGGG